MPSSGEAADCQSHLASDNQPWPAGLSLCFIKILSLTFLTAINVSVVCICLKLAFYPHPSWSLLHALCVSSSVLLLWSQWQLASFSFSFSSAGLWWKHRNQCVKALSYKYHWMKEDKLVPYWFLRRWFMSLWCRLHLSWPDVLSTSFIQFRPCSLPSHGWSIYINQHCTVMAHNPLQFVNVLR